MKITKLHKIDVNIQPVLIPTSTTRLDAEDEFVRLSHRIDSEIDKGLSASLLQFESRLEAALESIRQTVTNSLSARSQMCTDNESDVDQNCNPTSASKMQCIAGDKFQGGDLDRDVYHASDCGQVTMPNWFDSQTSLGNRVNEAENVTANQSMSNSHMVTGVGCHQGTASLGEDQTSTSHMVKGMGYHEAQNVTAIQSMSNSHMVTGVGYNRAPNFTTDRSESTSNMVTRVGCNRAPIFTTDRSESASHMVTGECDTRCGTTSLDKSHMCKF